MRATREILAEKTLPKSLRTQIEALSAALRKTWAELEADAAHDPVDEAAQERAIANLVEAVEYRNSVMVALFVPPDVAQQIVAQGEVAGALPAGELHITLAYLGDNAVETVDRAALEAVVESVARGFGGIQGKINGRGMFAVGDGVWAHVLLFDSPVILELRNALVRAIKEAGISVVENHGFTPHITVAYQRSDWPIGGPLPMEDVIFGEVAVSWGMEHRYFPMHVTQFSDQAMIESGYTELTERAVRADGTIPVKIIRPGWGASGYYPAEVLERDGPQVFTRGIKMYWNHPTQTEEAERPERDLRDLAAELVSDARWVGDHPAGPGLYADAKVFGPYKEALDELGPHIGVSIRAMGKAANGEMEGRSGAIISEISAARSVDFVTEPGAGGQILTLFEAARKQAATRLEEGTMADKELEALQKRVEQLEAENAELKKQLKSESEAKESAAAQVEAAQTEAARMKEAAGMLRQQVALSEASSIVFSELIALDMPEATRKRLTESLKRELPLTEAGVLDAEKMKSRVQETAKAELTYLAEASGLGAIRGMGGNTQGGTVDAEAMEASLAESFRAIGLSDEAAKVAAKGR